MPATPSQTGSKRHLPPSGRASPNGNPPSVKRPRRGSERTQGAMQESRFRLPPSFASTSARRSSSTREATEEMEGSPAGMSQVKATPSTGLLSRTRERASTIPGPAGTSRPDSESPPVTQSGRGAHIKVDVSPISYLGFATSLMNKATTLSMENQELAEALQEYAEHVEVLEEHLEDLLGRVETGRGASEEGPGQDVPPAVDEGAAVASATSADLRTRDFFACLRAVFLGLMGLQKKDQAPEPMKRGFWTHEDPRHADRRLRPRWDEGWPENRAAWATEVTLKVRQDARRWSSVLSQERLDALPADVIESGLETCFNRFAKQWKENQDSTEKAREEKARMNRRRQRKRNKATERWEHRRTVPELMEPEYLFAFDWHYQSTDESDCGESAIDPNTEDEGEGTHTAPSSSAVWVQHAPAYRADEVTTLLDRLDTAILRALKDKPSSAGKTRRMPRRRGAPRASEQSSMPVPRKRKSKVKGDEGDDELAGPGLTKIPLSKVNRGWLDSEHGAEYRSGKYIADWNNDGENGGRQDGEDGGDEERREEEGAQPEELEGLDG